MQQVRVRFAPSPTGHLHIGGLRTAIFNWLFVKHNNGNFLIRIEDTDIERSKKEYVNSILDSLSWMSMEPSEPIVIQSQRIDEHKKLTIKLLQEDKAYKCFCPARSTKELESDESYGKYPGTCRNRNETEQDLNKPFVIRFKIPKVTDFITFEDIVHGLIKFSIDQFDDFIIERSDGNPTYNFVVVADDIFMKITHVIRGEDHINNTPKQIFLYQALGFNIPQFAHLPLILNSAGEKLSKRDAVVSAIEYKKSGFLADALFNYLVRLGWSFKDQELFSREELIKLFTLENIGKSSAIFDIQKLEWFNGIYIKQKNAQELLNIIEKDLDTEFIKINNFNKDQILKFIDLYKDRIKTLVDLKDAIINLNYAPTIFDECDINEWIKKQTITYLEQVILELDKLNFNEWENEEILTDIIKNLSKKLDIKISFLAQPIRMALTGSASGPGVFKLLITFSKEESLKRLNLFLKFLQNKFT